MKSIKEFGKELINSLKFMDIVQEFEIKDIVKPTECYTGLCVKYSDTDVGISIPLETYYELMLSGNISMEEIIENISDEITRCHYAGGYDAERLIEKEYVKTHIFPELIPFNKDKLKHMPFKPFLDMAVIYRIAVEDINGSQGSIVITNEIFKALGFNIEELHNLAISNGAKICPGTIRDILEIVTQCNVIEIDRSNLDMLIISNDANYFGASAILYPGILERIRDTLKGDFYILPSSVHETIAVPKGDHSVEELLRMVQEVNTTSVLPKDRLTDNVYSYDSLNGTLASAK